MLDGAVEDRDEPTWRQRLGGRWAVSWQAYGIGVALNAPLLILTGGSIGAEPVELDQIPGWAVVAAVASGLTALWVVIGDRVLFPHRSQQPVPATAVVGYHAVTGLIFSASIWFVGPRVGVRATGTFTELAVPTVAIGLWFGLTMVLLLDARDRFARRREALLAESVSAEFVLLQEDEAARGVDALIRDRVGAVTADLRTEISTSMGALTPAEVPARSGADWRGLAARVRESAESSLRPLSHELWRAAEQQFPRPGWADVLRQWRATGSPAVVSSAVIVIIGYLRGGIYALGVLPGTLATLILAGAVAMTLLLASWAMSRAPRARGILAVLAFAAAQALGLAFTVSLPQQATPAEAMGSVVAMSVSVLAPSIVRALNAARGEVLERLRGSADAARARQIAHARMLADVTQRAARIIHGSLQTKLIAAAAAIEQAVDSEDGDLLARSLTHVGQLLEGSASRAIDDEGEALTAAVTRSCDAWLGILSTDVRISPEAQEIRGEAAHAAGLIVEEALANAYRHGQASSAVVTITCTREDDGAQNLHVAVLDDGSAEAMGPAGLGTVLMEGLCNGGLHLERQADGFLVTAKVRCR